MKRGEWVGGITFTVALAVAVSNGPLRADAIQRAVDRGVTYLKQNQVVHEGESVVGANALIGLALLECGVDSTDPAVVRVTELVRSASPGLTHTYSLALSVMFLDRLGDAGDVPLIQSMTVRLLAGQNSAGGWSYHCPALTQEEVNQLATRVKQRNELRSGADAPKTQTPRRPLPGEPPRDVQNQVQRLQRRGHGPGALDRGVRAGGDNSNTQFAILGLWVGHRHGVPVDTALELTERRFRQSQKPNGGWGYTLSLGPTATMTCAGLLGLAMGYGTANEAVLRTDGGAKDGKKGKTKTVLRDVGKDPAVRAGLQALGTVIGLPAAKTGLAAPPIPPGLAKRLYYFLWSLERVAVAYDLKTIGHKDWYAWGSEILVASQAPDGSWEGEYGAPVDTCFALLFLRRANFTKDLTTSLKGKVTDPGEVTLKAGGVGGEKGTGKAVAPIFDLSTPPVEASSQGANPKLVPPTPTVPGASASVSEDSTVDRQAARLSADLLKAAPGNQGKMLEEFKTAKGVAYTQALAASIPKLTGSMQAKARDALAERLMRMTAATLRERLKDDDAEMRAAAARACAGKEEMGHVPDLIALLDDPQPRVVRAARTALKYLANGKDFGPAAEATPVERAKAVAEWKAWWKNQKPR